MLLASLAYNAAPDDLRLVLIDRKNEDLVPFARLPHVEFAAWTADDARAAIHRVYAEIRRRTDDGRLDRTRLVLVVDELAQVDADALDILARHIVPVGRSKRVHVIAATQHPTVKLIGDKSNYPARLVGQVVDGATAAIATGRRSTGAELLPGAGAFLFVDGPNLERIQAYNLTADAAEGLIGVICDKWCAPLAPVRTGAHTPIALPAPAEIPPPAPVRTGAGGASAVQFPLPRRAPTPEEAAAIRALYAELGSQNRTIVAVYGSKSSDTHRWVSEALAAVETAPAPILRMAVR
jgi:DNA segregation ATPase FtsK/SpoIIIE-like protein